MSDSRTWFKKNCRMNNGRKQPEGAWVHNWAGFHDRQRGIVVTRIQFADSSADQRDQDALDRHEAVYGSTSLRINRTTNQT